MCGIAGVLGGAESVGPIIEALRHRGPDGVRVEQVRGGSVGHARLSIIDLECGWQPLHAAGSTVIGNGEIYNYLELIEEFGLQCATGSDFEPLLHLYAREGEKAFGRLRGMYAFCLIGGDGRTWLVRDPFGIKPLYVRRDHAGVVFASEPQALAPAAAPSTQGATEVLTLGYLAASGATVWPGVERVPPGAIWNVAPAETHSAPSHLTPLPTVVASAKSDEAELLNRLDAVLENSVAVHQRSDVPYGLFLSGGIDSTTIATLMSRLNARPVTAFTCGFESEGARDERRVAERVARTLDLDWRETTFGEEDFWRVLPEVAAALDDPTTDYATLPTYHLAAAAKGTLTVVLSGEGGDELFAGYGRYRRALRPTLLGGRPAEPQVDAPFLKTCSPAAAAARSPERDVIEAWRRAALENGGTGGGSVLERAQRADIATWLPNDLLLKLDRSLMAHGLEGRTPLLDREVAAFAFSLPEKFKVRGRYGKWILRRWLERHCPAAEPWARKQGFTVPVASWIAPRSADLAAALSRHRGLAQVCDMEVVQAVFSDGALAKHRWPLLFYAVWWNIHVDGMEQGEALSAVLGTV